MSHLNYTLLNTSTGDRKKHIKNRSRADGAEPEIKDPSFIWLLEVVVGQELTVDPATENRVVSGWVDDLANKTTTKTFSVVAKTAEELSEVADAVARAAKLEGLDAAKVTWLRTKGAEAAGTTVTSGNSVATLQAVVDGLAQFYPAFADLLEGQWVDKRGK